MGSRATAHLLRARRPLGALLLVALAVQIWLLTQLNPLMGIALPIVAVGWCFIAGLGVWESLRPSPGAVPSSAH